MNPVPSLLLNSPSAVNDWLVCAIIVVFLLLLFAMGPFRAYYIKTVKSMYRFRNPDRDVCFPPYSSFGFVSIFILSSFCIGIAILVYTRNCAYSNPEQLLDLLSFSGLISVVFGIKLAIYQMVNTFLFKSQTIMLKPTRWNCFFVTTYAGAGFLILLLSVLALFVGLPNLLLLIFVFIVRFLVVIGRVFKIKTVIFKNKRLNMGIIMYLCAFEIVPMLLTFVIWGRFISLT